ncbi:MAG: hypothetical protein ACRBF0_23610 [Calditrichia bacterium]
MNNKLSDSGKQKTPEKINWPARIWRTLIRLIPFLLLLYYFTYTPTDQKSEGKLTPVDSVQVDSLSIEKGSEAVRQ